ncbi:hypothetical protein VB716_12135 [Synechococcus sp. CCY9201]|uniref:hypothetical protein n=1 Tax=Synechococcus sp. CCY9201 TaxID=174697 RepID=UPI002B1F7414|nr:hypothetical protein [Synechococcus sp. CCY9201]MEA5474969.1 hypothetical protein [Synechococcus sp. CCY9201]
MSSAAFETSASTRLEITLPPAAALIELQRTDLLEDWLAQRIRQELRQLHPCLETLQHRWFHQSAVSLYLREARRNLDQVVFSLIRLDASEPASELAQEIYFRLLANELDPALPGLDGSLFGHPAAAVRSSRIGPTPLGSLQPQLADRLRISRPGVPQSPFSIAKDELLIVQLEQRLPASLDPATQRRLEHTLFNDWLRQRCRTALPQLEAAAAASPEVTAQPKAARPAIAIPLPD